MSLDVAYVGAKYEVDRDSGVVFVEVTSDQQGEESLGDGASVPLMQAIGVTAVPYGPSGEGSEAKSCEVVVAKGAGGYESVIIGGRDSRSAAMVGKMGPGDTVVHTTGPNRVAQLQLKEKKRQAVLITRKEDGEMMILCLDGVKKNFQVLVNGALIQIDKNGTIDLSSPNGKNGISISNSVCWVRGNVLLGGRNPMPGMALQMGPAVPTTGGPAAPPLVPAMGVAIGV